jgi:hypothetical protein
MNDADKTQEQKDAYEAGFFAGVEARAKGVYKARECFDRCPHKGKGDKTMVGHPLGQQFIQGWKDAV